MGEFNVQMETDKFLKAIKSWRDFELLGKMIKLSRGLFYATGMILVIGFWAMFFTNQVITKSDLVCVEAKAKGCQLEQCEKRP